MAGLSRAPLFLLALALALALTASPAAGANASRPRPLGGLAEADVNEEGVQQALNFALSEYNKASNDAYHSRAMRVVRARTQVRPGAGRWGLGSGPGAGREDGEEEPAPREGVALVTRQPRPKSPPTSRGGRPAVSLVFPVTDHHRTGSGSQALWVSARPSLMFSSARPARTGLAVQHTYLPIKPWDWGVRVSWQLNDHR